MTSNVDSKSNMIFVDYDLKHEGILGIDTDSMFVMLD